MRLQEDPSSSQVTKLISQIACFKCTPVHCKARYPLCQTQHLVMLLTYLPLISSPSARDSARWCSFLPTSHFLCLPGTALVDVVVWFFFADCSTWCWCGVMDTAGNGRCVVYSYNNLLYLFQHACVVLCCARHLVSLLFSAQHCCGSVGSIFTCSGVGWEVMLFLSHLFSWRQSERGRVTNRPTTILLMSGSLIVGDSVSR